MSKTWRRCWGRRRAIRTSWAKSWKSAKRSWRSRHNSWPSSNKSTRSRPKRQPNKWPSCNHKWTKSIQATWFHKRRTTKRSWVSKSSLTSWKPFAKSKRSKSRSMRSFCLQENRRTKSWLRKKNGTRRKCLSWRAKFNTSIRAITMSPRRWGKRRKPSSSSQAKFTISRWNSMPKKPKKIKNLNPSTLNGHSSMTPSATSTNREFNFLIRKNCLQIKEFNKRKPKSKNSSHKPKSTKPMPKISRESFKKKSKTSKKTDSQSSPKRTTKSKESLKRTRKITTSSSKSKLKTASFPTSLTSPAQRFPSWTWRRKKANKRSRA